MQVGWASCERVARVHRRVTVHHATAGAGGVFTSAVRRLNGPSGGGRVASVSGDDLATAAVDLVALGRLTVARTAAFAALQPANRDAPPHHSCICM